MKPIILVGTELLYNGPNVVAVVIKENGGKETWRLKTKDMEDLWNNLMCLVYDNMCDLLNLDYDEGLS